jgi:GTP-binding protein YchF
MSLEIGIVGLPNVGKSTLFNALTNAGAEVASYPFTTIEPNVGVVPLGDPRLQYVADLVQPEKVLLSTVRFVDIAGLVRGAHLGEGLGNEFLGHIRTVDAIAMVLRCFEEENVAHVDARLDPVSDAETVWTEMILADLDILDRRLDKVRDSAKARPRDVAAELEWLTHLRDHLDAGQKAQSFPLLGSGDPSKWQDWLSEVALVTVKPHFYVANVGEDDLPSGGAYAARVRELAEREQAESIVLCAQIEMELQEWPASDASAYLAELGLSEPGLQRLVRAGYRTLGLITFFTATGTRAVQAWPILEGTTALEAAGQIHSDMERGFIRAEVVAFDDLKALGSFAAVREHGRLRVEGRNYVVRDGDIVHFRFNV